MYVANTPFPLAMIFSGIVVAGWKTNLNAAFHSFKLMFGGLLNGAMVDDYKNKGHPIKTPTPTTQSN